MEDDGAAGARTRHRSPRKRALFGLLDADGWAWAAVKAFAWLVIIILMLGYLPGPGLLPDRRPDGRPGRPRLVADQPLPADERDPAVPGAGRRVIPWQPSPAELTLPAAAHRRRAPPGRDEDPVHRRHRRDDRPVDGLRRPDRRDRQLRQVGRGPDAPRAARRRERRVRGRQHLRHRRPRRLGRPDDDRLRAEPRQPDRRARATGRRPRTWPCPRRAPRPPRRHARRPAAHRRTQRRRAGRHDIEDQAQRQGHARGVVAGAAARHAAGRRDRRR